MKKYLDISTWIRMSRIAVFAVLGLSVNSALAQTYQTITGDVLKINVSNRGSYQVYHRDVTNFATGQFFPHLSSVGDYGWYVAYNNKLYGQDGAAGPHGTVEFTNTTVSAVTGSGTQASPFQIVASGNISPDITFETKDTYVNGQNYFRQQIKLTNISASDLSVNVYLGGDIYLANDDSGKPVYVNGAPGGETCTGSPMPGFNILIFGLNPLPSHYTANTYRNVWNQLETTGDLDDQIASFNCRDNGAAVQWKVDLPANGVTTILGATSFGDIPQNIRDYNINVNVVPANAGNVTCSATTVSPGGNATCTVTANAGFVFTGWGDDCASAGNQITCSLTNINSDKTVTANFSAAGVTVYNINIIPVANNAGTITCSATTVTSGGNVTCTVTANTGFVFDGWGDDCVSAGNQATCSLTNINSDKTVSANFTAATPVAPKTVPSLSFWALVLMTLSLIAATTLFRRQKV